MERRRDRLSKWVNRHLFPGRGELDSVSLLSFNETGKLDGVSALEKLKLPFRELCHNVTFEGVNESDAPFPPQGGESSCVSLFCLESV